MNPAVLKRAWSRCAVAMLALAALAAAGCGLTSESGPQAPESYTPGSPPRDLPKRSLKALRHRVLENASKFKTLTASCQAKIMSPLIRGDQKRASMSGELYIQKPGKVHLELYGGGKTYVELTGNGRAYRADMPLFGNTQFSGEYGDSIRWRPDRLHFMPDDLVDLLDRDRWFDNRAQVLRSSKKPPKWQIDNLALQSQPQPSVRVVSKLTINRRTQHVRSFVKYADDGSVRVEAWFRSIQLVQTGDRSVRVPSKIWMHYPIDGTWIGLSLDNIELNVDIEPDRFKLG